MAESVGIVGCGVAGMACAIFLRRLGYEVSVYDKFAKPEAIGAGILIQPSGLFVLQKLGLLDHLQAQSSRIELLLGTTPSGREILKLNYQDYHAQCYGLGLHRGNLFSALYQAANKAGVEIVAECEISKLRQQTKVQLWQGSKCIAEHAAIIVANGSHSSLRECLAVKQKSRLYPWGALWKIFPDPHTLYPGVLRQVYKGTGIMLGLLPTGIDPTDKQPCISFFWSLKASEYATWRTKSLENWRRQVLGYWPELEAMLAGINVHENLEFARYADVIMERWHDRRVLCVGDAAHGMSPQLGQGANLALVDAWTLFECLQETQNLQSAFANYSHRRRAHIRYYQWASRFLTPLFQSNSKLLGWGRDVATPIGSHLPIVKQSSLKTLVGLKQSVWHQAGVFTDPQVFSEIS